MYPGTHLHPAAHPRRQPSCWIASAVRPSWSNLKCWSWSRELKVCRECGISSPMKFLGNRSSGRLPLPAATRVLDNPSSLREKAQTCPHGSSPLGSTESWYQQLCKPGGDCVTSLEFQRLLSLGFVTSSQLFELHPSTQFMMSQLLTRDKGRDLISYGKVQCTWAPHNSSIRHILHHYDSFHRLVRGQNLITQTKYFNR